MTSEIAGRLAALAQIELAEITTYLDRLDGWSCGGLLIEACRCLDHAHVMQELSTREEAKLTPHDFDIILRGWNVFFSLLLTRVGGYAGVPMGESTPEMRQAIMGMLHTAGRYVLLDRTAEMVRHGMVTGVMIGDEIELELSDRALVDHFHDQVDRGKLADLNRKVFDSYRPAHSPDDAHRLRGEMGKLTFPWETPKGVMVGYTAAPEIDAFFLQAVMANTLQWRDDAGIHPGARLGAFTGGVLTGVVHVLLSFYLKHIMFVEEAIKRHPGVNQHMSLTIWKTRADLVASLVATGAPAAEAEAALDFITVRPADAAFFMNEHTPGIPLVIEIADGYLLTPISGIFRNPFNHIRMLREATSPAIQNAFREDRETWMVDDLYALFDGPRFQRVAGQTRLRRNGKTVTDIDAAIFDNATEELVLFQLKWQDFTTSNVRTQRSKAKNFVDQVQAWATKTTL